MGCGCSDGDEILVAVNLAGTLVGEDHPAFCIAEIGHNHQGSVQKAIDLIDIAARAGASAVKLQKRDNKTLFTESYYNSPYNSENAFGATYGEHREALEFGKKEYLELMLYASTKNIAFFAAAFDIPSADFLEDIGVPFYKIASGGATNTTLLKHVAKFGKPMIISLGGCTPQDILRVYDAVRPINSQLVFMHCVAAYPAPVDLLNLMRIVDLKKWFPDVVAGFSDHQDGISMGPVAYALGARVFEKHITFSHSAKGTDHAFSLEEAGLTTYIKYINHAVKALKRLEQPLEEEKAPIKKMSQGVYAARDMEAGTWLRQRDLALKSPASQVAAWWYEVLVGKVLREHVKKDEPILTTHIEGGLGA